MKAKPAHDEEEKQIRGGKVFLSEEAVEKVLDRINGRIPEDDVLKDMKTFFREEFSVDIIDYITDSTEDGLLRLQILVKDVNDTLPFLVMDSTLEDKIKEEFSRSCREHDLNSDYFVPADYFVFVSDFESDVVNKAMTAVNKKTIKDVLKGYPEVKEHSISGSTVFVFYQTEKDLETYRQNGLTVKIYDEISGILGDAAGMEGRRNGDIRFSSREEFYGKYQGNFHAFWLDH